ncbi:MAG: hypothetical protein BroJett030_20560 [Alphaproteobacteria bacterium]|nr:MAG: hypothetical protein BroJett030_20560 [Alphaproteobacteria bacterium]
MSTRIIAALVFIAAIAGGGPADAQSSKPVRVGLLTCQVDGSQGHILGSRRELSCIFESVAGGPVEHYAGEIRRIGVDIGSTRYSDIAWGVFSLARPYAPGALQGTYAGLSGGLAVGVGLGANVLIGGLEQSFALQPISLEATSGFNLALGVAQLNLISTGAFR